MLNVKLLKLEIACNEDGYQIWKSVIHDGGESCCHPAVEEDYARYVLVTSISLVSSGQVNEVVDGVHVHIIQSTCVVLVTAGQERTSRCLLCRAQQQ